MYYVDGYNVLHKSSRLRPLARVNLEAAREALIDKIANFCIATGQQVTIVFDGLGGHKPEAVEHYRNVAELKLLYAPKQHSADAVIERCVYQAHNRIETVVISNDRGLRDICRGLGALVMDADNFLTVVQDAQREMHANLAHRGKNVERADPSIEERLDPKVRDALEKLRKKLR